MRLTSKRNPPHLSLQHAQQPLPAGRHSQAVLPSLFKVRLGEVRSMAGRLVLYKVVVLGDGGVGKTALTIQTGKLCLQHFVETYDPTIEDSYRKQVVIDGEPCMLEILDTAGQEEYTALRAQWIRDGEAFLLVYSISSRSSFSRVQMFHKQILRITEEAAPFASLGPPIMLVGNKSDRVTEREVSTQEGHALAQELGMSFVEVSAKNCINVEKSVYDVIRQLRRERQMSHRTSTSKQLTGHLMKKTFWGAYKIPIPLEERKTNKGRTKLLEGLMQSAKTNNEKALVAYLEAGADINGHSRSDGSALHASSAAGHANIVNILLKKGAALNALGPTGVPPLQLAAAEGHAAVVRLLLHKGAVIDQTSTLHGTALMAAASRGRAETVRLLLKNRATVNIPGGRYGNALQAAAWNGNPEVIRYLLDSGADINARGAGDCTALQMSAFVGKHKAVQVLLDRGANIGINAPGGKYGTALKAANDGGHYEAVILLLNAGGKDTPDKAEAPRNDEQSHSHSDDRNSNQPVQTANRMESSFSLNIQSPTNSDLQVPLGTTSQGSLVENDNKSSLKEPTKVWSQHSRRSVHPTGFSTLHDSPTAAVDIVFVHGLQGHPEKTWTHSGAEVVRGPRLGFRFFKSIPTPSTEPAPRVYWPYDLLAQSADFADTRIMTWGYDTKVVKEFFGNSDQQNISQHGNNLLVCLQQERKGEPDRPLIFVCHSLGGIIVKVSFLQMLEDGHFNIHSFYETRAVGSYGLNSLALQVVPFESALVGHAKKETSLGLAGNHAEICKFSGIDDPGYRAVFGALQDYIMDGIEPVGPI
ncbi:hypothetical protein S7711_07767 [Stachybotrys chartarum IBT 7711]|uniref:Uncharacterized protein n=1 Tax=Stachybotrys chartarum (strain CBS 109288 / IBT 7711) TaxID=1280523 RepID=A0A084B8P6_STACB|nr:hypothetical protein S7711_07767 [Stachybotrys chartarum IBT 7711]